MSLTLFSIIDFEPKLSEEALLIEEFKVLFGLAYNKAKGDTQGRERKRALQECRYLYHKYDYKSEYSEYNETEKEVEALQAAGLPLDYKISKELQACGEVFIKLQDTRMLRALHTAEGALDKVDEYYKAVDFAELTLKGELLHNPDKVMTSISNLGIVNKKLSDLRKLVRSELKAAEGLRGDKEGGLDTAE